MPDERRVSLEVERLRVEGWHAGQAPYVPLAVAAAMTFHQAHGNTKAIVSREDYDDALNMAASALSRLIPILTIRDPREGRVPIRIDLARERFSRGAAELNASDGTSIAELSVRTSDLFSAISLIKRTGLPFGFVALPDEKNAEGAPAPAKPPTVPGQGS